MRSSSDQLPAPGETELLTNAELSEKYPPTRILRPKEVIATIGLGRAAIYQMQREGKFPKPVKIGVRAVGWVAEDVLAWIARRANRQIAPQPTFPKSTGSRAKARSPKLRWRNAKYTEMISGVSRSTNPRSYRATRYRAARSPSDPIAERDLGITCRTSNR